MSMRIASRVGVGLSALLVALPVSVVHASDVRGLDSRTWSRRSTTVGFHAPESYGDCRPRGLTDTIWTTGMSAAGFALRGRVNVGYITNGLMVVMYQLPVDVDGDLRLVVPYPPHSEVLAHSGGLIEYHVEPQIEVFDRAGQKVFWVGGDQTHASGTLGPGGQDWDVYCHGPGGTVPPPRPTAGPSGGCATEARMEDGTADWYAGTSLRPSTTFQSVFGNVRGLKKLTWAAAISLEGDGLSALVREAARAVLNAERQRGPLPVDRVVSVFKAALSERGIDRTTQFFAYYNELTCPAR